MTELYCVRLPADEHALDFMKGMLVISIGTSRLPMVPPFVTTERSGYHYAVVYDPATLETLMQKVGKHTNKLERVSEVPRELIIGEARSVSDRVAVINAIVKLSDQRYRWA